MAMQKVLITGSNGMLGREIVKVLFGTYELFGINRHIIQTSNIKQFAIDLTDIELLKNEIKKFTPDIVILCAANVTVDGCESNKEFAYKLHVQSTDILSSTFKNARFIYISTDSVFDGDTGDYKETDAAKPRNYYNQTKFEGENVTLKNNSNAVIIRANIYGLHLPLKNSLAEWTIQSLSNNQNIDGFLDIYFNPVYTKHLAVIINRIFESNFKGIIHVGTKRYISKLDFILEVAKVFNFSTELIRRISINEFKDFTAIRPLNTTLNTDKYKLLFKIPVPDIVIGLNEIKNEYDGIKVLNNENKNWK